MDLHYVEPTASERDALYAQMQAEGLLPFAMAAFAAPTLEDWRTVTAGGVLLCCHEGGRVLGCAQFTPFYGQVWKFDFTAFRAGFACAAEQARGGFAWMFRQRGASALVGITPARYGHALALAEACGFVRVARLPGACWLARRACFVEGVLLLCTPESLREAQQGGFMSFGGGGSTPTIAPVPKAQSTKPVTEAATAARDAQKNRARKAAGLTGSILTDAVGGDAGGKTLLGQ